MAVKPTSLLGDESVYCINEAQLKESARLMEDPQSAPRLKHLLKTIEEQCNRNERAALASGAGDGSEPLASPE